MGISSSLLIGVSGLTSNAEAMSVISNNIANVNTTAYKRNSASFQQLVSGQTKNGATGNFNGTGVVNRTRQFITQEGAALRTGQATDLTIAGNGFFIVANKNSGLSETDVRQFTRLGDFQPDLEGYLRNSGGQYLLGWPQDSDGNFDYDVADINTLQPIKVTGLTGIGLKSTTVAVGANLDTTTAISTGVATYNAVTKNMAQYAVNNTTGTKPDFEISIPVIDSKGGTRTLTLSVLKSNTPNQWFAEIRGKPSEIAGSADGLISSGTLAFKPDGTFDLANSNLFGAGLTKLTIGASAATTGTRWAAALGIEDNTFTFDFTTGLRQNAATTQVNNVTSNGNATGNLASLSVSNDGALSAVFDNGAVVGLSTIGLATFNNADGLSVGSGGAFNQTTESGNFNLKIPGLGGAGIIGSKQLEASNVDLTSEFTGLITTQRAYSASSKIITTADQMLDELINIKR